jgi:hypothetical protein
LLSLLNNLLAKIKPKTGSSSLHTHIPTPLTTEDDWDDEEDVCSEKSALLCEGLEYLCRKGDGFRRILAEEWTEEKDGRSLLEGVMSVHPNFSPHLMSKVIHEVVANTCLFVAVVAAIALQLTTCLGSQALLPSALRIILSQEVSQAPFHSLLQRPCGGARIQRSQGRRFVRISKGCDGSLLNLIDMLADFPVQLLTVANYTPIIRVSEIPY